MDAPTEALSCTTSWTTAQRGETKGWRDAPIVGRWWGGTARAGSSKVRWTQYALASWWEWRRWNIALAVGQTAYTLWALMGLGG